MVKEIFVTLDLIHPAASGSRKQLLMTETTFILGSGGGGGGSIRDINDYQEVEEAEGTF